MTPVLVEQVMSYATTSCSNNLDHAVCSQKHVSCELAVLQHRGRVLCAHCLFSGCITASMKIGNGKGHGIDVSGRRVWGTDVA